MMVFATVATVVAGGGEGFDRPIDRQFHQFLGVLIFVRMVGGRDRGRPSPPTASLYLTRVRDSEAPRVKRVHVKSHIFTQKSRQSTTFFDKKNLQ